MPWGRWAGGVLLVGVLHVALVSLGEGGHDDAVALVEQVLLIVRAFADGGDGSVDDHAEGMPRDETEAAHAGQEVETAVESDGYDG